MLGVENEIDEGGKSDENAGKLLDIANEKEDHLYINVSFEGFCTINPSPQFYSLDGHDDLAASALKHNPENIL